MGTVFLIGIVFGLLVTFLLGGLLYGYSIAMSDKKKEPQIGPIDEGYVD